MQTTPNLNTTFFSVLEHFRVAELRSLAAIDLVGQDAERVVHNAALFDSRRSLDDEVVEIVKSPVNAWTRFVE